MNTRRALLMICLLLAIPLASAGTICIDKTAPSAPSNLVITETSGYAQLSWTAATDEPACSGIDHYNIYRNKNGDSFYLIGNTSSTTFSDPVALAPGTYNYKVTAVDRVKFMPNEGPAVEGTIIIGETPPGPACGDGNCDVGETAETCPEDCITVPAPFCGDSTCNADENCSTCPQDCGSCPAVCGNNSCETGESCSSCPADCGACPVTPPSSGGGSSGGGGGGGGGGLNIALQVNGNCIGKPTSIRATLNGNPVSAGNIAVKHNSKITNYSTDSNGFVSVTFADLGIYEFTATKSLLNPSTQIVELISCTGTSAGDKNTAGAADLCKNINCDDKNPCTKDSCANGICKYAAQPDGTSCPIGSCQKGVCTQPVQAETGNNGTAPTGFFGLGANGNIVAGLILVFIIGMVFLFLRVQKKK